MCNVELNKYSKTLTKDPTQPATQAMFYGIGFQKKISIKHRLELQVWVMTVILAICT
jgi:hypothetical protein